MANYYIPINLDGGGGGGGGAAEDISYDNSTSGLPAANVQQAIDSLASSSYKPRPLITLNAGDISAGSISITVTPSSPTLTRLSVGGLRQTYGVDFTVSGSTLTWSGLGLDGILEDGDILQIELK